MSTGNDETLTDTKWKNIPDWMVMAYGSSPKFREAIDAAAAKERPDRGADIISKLGKLRKEIEG